MDTYKRCEGTLMEYFARVFSSLEAPNVKANLERGLITATN